MGVELDGENDVCLLEFSVVGFELGFDGGEESGFEGRILFDEGGVEGLDLKRAIWVERKASLSRGRAPREKERAETSDASARLFKIK